MAGAAVSELSEKATRSAYREETEEAWICLLTITHPDLSVPDDIIRVCNEGVAVDEEGNEYVDSNGERFYAFPFEFEMPKDVEGETATAKLRIDNAGKVKVPDGGGFVEVNILHELRRIGSLAGGNPALVCQVVLADAPDDVEFELADLTLQHVGADAALIEGDLAWEDVLNQECPTVEYTPATAPGLWP